MVESEEREKPAWKGCPQTEKMAALRIELLLLILHSFDESVHQHIIWQVTTCSSGNELGSLFLSLGLTEPTKNGWDRGLRGQTVQLVKSHGGRI